MLLVYIIIGICIFFQAERGILDTHSYLRLFRSMKNKPSKVVTQINRKQVLYILIPVLREQTIIEETVLRFLKLKNSFFNIQLIIITTIREQKEIFDKSTTEEVIKNSLEFGILSQFKKSVSILRDPNKKGNMATQLNYAIQYLKKNSSDQNIYIVYNADSIISPMTFMELSRLTKKEPSEFAFQQPCAYVSEMKPGAPNFLNALSLYQSWYCLGHESDLILKYEKIKNLGVMVGHGSGMTINMNIKNGGYPEKLLTEDLTFGFILSARKEPIFLLPALELADVPNKFSVFIRQKSIWFWNYLGYISCYKKMRAEGHTTPQLLPIFLEGIGAGIYWFSSALFVLVPLSLSLATGVYWLAFISLIATTLFCIFPQYILFRKLPDILEQQGFQQNAQNIKKISFLKILPSLCLIIITDSLGPWIATYRYFMYCFSGKLPIKYKTGD